MNSQQYYCKIIMSIQARHRHGLKTAASRQVTSIALVKKLIILFLASHYRTAALYY